VTSEDPLDAHARKARLVLPEVIDLVDPEPFLQDHRPADGGGPVAVSQRPADPPRRHPGDLGELMELARTLRPRGWQVLRANLHGELGAVPDHHLALPVEDVAARRLYTDLPDPVVVRLGAVLVPGEDLDVPEA